MRTLVMKFGGSSIGMTTGLGQMVGVVLHERDRWERLILIVSALEGVTDALLEAAQFARHGNRRSYRRIVATLRTRHLALVDLIQVNPGEQSGLLADIDRLLFEVLDQCQALADGVSDIAHEDALIDAIVGAGERLAARIVAALLRHHQLRGVAVDATDLIISDTVHGHATPDYALSRERCRTMLTPLLERQIVPVITGFIASGTDGLPTTLGRGGSDLSAAVLAVALDADEVWLWTNVDGIMTGDPHIQPNARVISSLSYPEAADYALFGAHILHARMIRPLAEHQVALRVRNVYHPRVAGTRIHSEHATGLPLKAVTGTQGLGLFSLTGGALHAASACIDDCLNELTGSRVEATLVAQSAGPTVACFVIPASAGPEALHGLTLMAQERLDELEVNVWQLRPVGIVTLAGAMAEGQIGTLASALNAVDGLHVLAVSANPSRTSLSIAVELADLAAVVSRLHELILSESPHA